MDVPFYSQKVGFEGEDSGFPDAASAAEWEHNCCGIACARMVLKARTGHEPGYWSLLQAGLTRGAYIEAGWIHRGLVQLIGEHGVRGRAHRNKTVDDLEKAVAQGSLCIASVTVLFLGGKPHRDTGQPHRRGGHLVLAFAGPSGELLCHHPSSLEPGNHRAWRVDREAWDASFSGNFMEFPVEDIPT